MTRFATLSGFLEASLLLFVLFTSHPVQAQFIFDPCANFECQNGGTCTAPADRPFCQNCNPGFTGERCEIRISRDPCANFKCQNGGTCTAPADRPYCKNCNPGFTGERCEISISYPGACPVIEPGTVGVCGTVAFCQSDSECSYGQRCCPMACGGRTCTPVEPVVPKPLTNVDGACDNVRCSKGTSCRIAKACPTCDLFAQCVPPSQYEQGIDAVCERQRYIQVLLVASHPIPSPATVYSELKCTVGGPVNSCPQGSVCVDDQAGGGSCCTGKPDPNDRCGGCKAGETCVDRQPDCPPGRFCIQAFIPTCVPNDCAECTFDQDCIPTPNQPVCAVGFDCPTTYQCAARDRCGSTPCPQGQQCNFVGTLCVDPAPGTPIDPTQFGCFDQYRCEPVDDCQVSGCPKGEQCVDTGVRCVTQPCPTHECRPVDECGNECRKDQTCRALFPPCAPPPDCDALRALDPNAVCPDPPRCDPVYTCVDNPTEPPPSPPLQPVCSLRCPPNYECQFVRPRCAPGGLCNVTPVQECRPRRRCPRPSRRYRSTSPVCRFESYFMTSCTSDNDCDYNLKCCTSKCGKSVCLPAIPPYGRYPRF